MMLSLTLVRVLSSEPGALAKFATRLPQPEVLSNDDRALEKPLLELTKVLTPKQARDLSRHAPRGRIFLSFFDRSKLVGLRRGDRSALPRPSFPSGRGRTAFSFRCAL